MPARSSGWSTSFLVEAEMQFEQKGVALVVNEAARGLDRAKGYDPRMGARPMARVIQEYVKRPLAEELLFGKLAHGGQALVSLAADGNGLSIECVPAPEPEVAV